jgi:hypothetical protein
MNQDDLKLWGGVLGVALVLSTGYWAPKMKGVVDKVKKVVPNLRSGEKNALEKYTDHELVTFLMGRCTGGEKDEEGLLLLSAYGKHLYDHAARGENHVSS